MPPTGMVFSLLPSVKKPGFDRHSLDISSIAEPRNPVSPHGTAILGIPPWFGLAIAIT